MNSEKLKPQEQASSSPDEPSSNFTRLDEGLIKAVMEQRQEMLEKIKPELSLKAYYAMEEKLTAEELRLKEILDLRLGRQKHMARYTFILDPRYFDQEFFSS